MALYHEKVDRNYEEAKNCYDEGGKALKSEFAAFNKRMVENKRLEPTDVLSSNFSKKRMLTSGQDVITTGLKKLKIEGGSSRTFSFAANTSN
jgi:hypothetical protein